VPSVVVVVVVVIVVVARASSTFITEVHVRTFKTRSGSLQHYLWKREAKSKVQTVWL